MPAEVAESTIPLMSNVGMLALNASATAQATGMNTTPAAVGVPALVWWHLGPFIRIICFIPASAGILMCIAKDANTKAVIQGRISLDCMLVMFFRIKPNIFGILSSRKYQLFTKHNYFPG